ncbi:MAG: glycosyltransferase family 2 protein [Niabella sp.]|nr:glycosyltransferase family 2 protein [Niabella sp.]
MDKLNPLVTIAIPTFNQERYIETAITSALNQDYPNLEIIVCDDNSTDRTFEMINKIRDPRVKIYRTTSNLGRVANYRYILYQLAKGDWMVMLDGDDYYSDPTFISGALKQVNEDPDLVMYVAAASSLIENSGELVPAPIFLKHQLTKLKGLDYVLGFYKYGAIGQHFAVIYKRSLALATNFYSLDSLGADTDSICRLALKGFVLIEKKWVGVWRSHGNNASYTLSVTNVDKEVKMLRSIADEALKYGEEKRIETWFKENALKKRKTAIYEYVKTLPKIPALKILIRNWTWSKQDFKEVVKKVIRY